ncbi:MAG: UDP-N-acetylmuramate dehydrogenase [Oscillospiraceae bacterium]|nr:UDP-N-acetylmuramate dehydrogenase [Oscillospiraceae bacterium]
MDKTQIFAEYCKEKGCLFKTGEYLSGYTSFKIGGTADIVVFPENADSLVFLMDAIKQNGLKYILLGNGSNVLLCENHFDGIAIITSRMDSMIIEGESVYAECGVPLGKLALETKSRGLSGLEFAYGIPGTIGGAVYMNAGAYGGQMSDVVHSSLCLDAAVSKIKNLDSKSHEFAYRESAYGKKKDLILLSAILNLKRGDAAQIESAMETHMAARKEKQPLDYPSAGSAFKRGNGYYASKLIEECGLKGYGIGGAEVSIKHAGFIINKGKASFSDVKNLICHVRSAVFEATGIQMECEIKIMEW